MKKYKTESFLDAFKNLGIEKSDVLFIHSSIMDFGWPSDLPLSKLPEYWYKNLSDLIGSEGSLVVPTFNFEFCKGKEYNPSKTVSKNMGVFSEFIRKLPDSKRSLHAMQSIAVIGKHAGFLTEIDTSSAFEKESAFDRLIALNPKVLLIGADFGFNSAFHWIEEKLKVPYRYWKNFEAPYTFQGKTQSKTYSIYVRDLEWNPTLNFRAIEKQLEDSDLLQKEKVGMGWVISYRMKDFLRIAEKKIKLNPYYFIENHSDFERNNIINHQS